MKVALYRFYIREKARYGASFGLCPEHAKTQKIPKGCELVALAIPEPPIQCVKCQEEKHDSRTSEVPE